MRIIIDWPPNIATIRQVFDLSGRHPVFTWGSDLYNPHALEVSPDLEVHEKVHEKQQADNPEQWWEKYLVDKNFRLEQEVEAYQEQYKFVHAHYGRRLSRLYLQKFARDLSSPMYGNVCRFNKAEKLIKSYVKETPAIPD